MVNINIEERRAPSKPDILRPGFKIDPNLGVIPEGPVDIGYVSEAETDDNGDYIGTYAVKLLSRDGLLSGVQSTYESIGANTFTGEIYPVNTKVLIIYATGKNIPIILGALSPDYRGRLGKAFKRLKIKPKPGEKYIIPNLVLEEGEEPGKTKQVFDEKGNIKFNVKQGANISIDVGGVIQIKTVYSDETYKLQIDHEAGFQMIIDTEGNLRINSDNKAVVSFEDGVRVSSDGKVAVDSDDIDLGVTNSSELVKKEWVDKVFDGHKHLAIGQCSGGPLDSINVMNTIPTSITPLVPIINKHKGICKKVKGT